MTEIVQAPAPLALSGVAGDPFSLTLNVTLTDANGSPIVWGAVTALAGLVTGVPSFVNQIIPLTAQTPTVNSPSSGVVTVAWSAAQTLQFPQYTQTAWSLSADISAAGPYALVAGSIEMTPSTQPGASTSPTASLVVSVGAIVVNLAVTVG